MSVRFTALIVCFALCACVERPHPAAETLPAEAALDDARGPRLEPTEWTLAPGRSVQFRLVNAGTAQLWVAASPEADAGDSLPTGSISADGRYQAPAWVEPARSVEVRAQTADGRWLSAQVHLVEAAAPAAPWRAELEPRVVDLTRRQEHRLRLETQGSVEAARVVLATGDRVELLPTRQGRFEARLDSDALTQTRAPGVMQHLAGQLELTSGTQTARSQLYVLVREAGLPVPFATRLGWDVQRTDHVLNVRDDRDDREPQYVEPLARRFFAAFPDEVDFLAVVYPTSTYRNRHYVGVRNDVEGLGLPTFDLGAAFGSATRLQGVVHFPIDTYFDLASRAASHELGHRWLAAFSLGGLERPPHWPVSDLARGMMGWSGENAEGLDFPFRLVEHPDGLELESAPLEQTFNTVELYAMGLASPDEVDGVYRVPLHAPADQVRAGGRFSGAVKELRLRDFVAANGARQPSHTSAQRSFRLATVVVSRDRLLTLSELAVFERLAARGEAIQELPSVHGVLRERQPTERPFHLATWGRARLQTSLPIQAPGCAQGCFLTVTGHATNQLALATQCAVVGAYARGNEQGAEKSCWRCGRSTRAGTASTSDAPGGGWNGGGFTPACDASLDP